MEMWEAYGKLEKVVRSNDGSQPVLETVFRFLKEETALALKQLTGPPSGLGKHLADVKELIASLALSADGRSRFRDLLTDREAALLVDIVADMHDGLKYLGTEAAQVAPDHEVMTAELIRNSFEGKSATIGGVSSMLTRDDIDFLVEVIGDHENLEKEVGREAFIRSGVATDHAKALFFVADTLSGSVIPVAGQDGPWQLDAAQLDARFGDLFFRHLDAVNRKIFRPEWGVATIKNLVDTFQQLELRGMRFIGPSPEESFVDALAAVALKAIDKAFAEDNARWQAAGPSGPEKYLSNNEIVRINKARAEITALRS
jgi:hypothetical protein